MVCSSASTSSTSSSLTAVKFGIRMSSKPSRFSKPLASPAVVARRSLLRRIRRQELRKLRALLPNLRRQQREDELAVVQEAVRYIDQLHATILARMYSGSLSYENVARLHPFTVQQIQAGAAAAGRGLENVHSFRRFQDVAQSSSPVNSTSNEENAQRLRLLTKMAAFC